MHFQLPGNAALADDLQAFMANVRELKAAHPLPEPFAYHRHNLQDMIWSVLAALDRNGVDLRDLVRDKTVLDLACADGELAFFLERHTHARSVCGLDTDMPVNTPRGRGFATLKQHLPSRADFVLADIHALDFATLPKFDVVFCLGFLYHSPHPMWVLENLARKAGTLVLGTKVFDHDEPYIYFYEPGDVGGDVTNWMCPSPKALRRMLERARFDVVFLDRQPSAIKRADPVDPKRDGRVIALAVPNLQRHHWIYPERLPPALK